MVGNHQTSIFKWLALGFQVFLFSDPLKNTIAPKGYWFHQDIDLHVVCVSSRDLPTRKSPSTSSISTTWQFCENESCDLFRDGGSRDPLNCYISDLQHLEIKLGHFGPLNHFVRCLTNQVFAALPRWMLSWRNRCGSNQFLVVENGGFLSRAVVEPREPRVFKGSLAWFGPPDCEDHTRWLSLVDLLMNSACCAGFFNDPCCGWFYTRDNLNPL